MSILKYKTNINMFYRRKILLSLIETFGGHLKRTDFQKLLFNFCTQTKNYYYEFFPYHFGSYSFLASQDKSVLAKYGYLRTCKDYVLTNNHNFITELNKKDKNNLKKFYSEFRNIKRKSLIRYTYLNHPEYTCRSKILNDILNPSEIEQVQRWWNIDETPRLFSLGYEGLTIDGYLNKLVLNNIKVLIDVRKNPLSMKYGFSKTRFRNYLEKAGIKYVHIPELGIPSNLRQNLNNLDDYKKLFIQYEKSILPSRTIELKDLENYLFKYKRVALTCFEKDYNYCHRHKITEYLELKNKYKYSIIHL